MSASQRYLLLLFVVTGMLAVAAPSSKADLQSYVRKYQSASISTEALRRIARYDHLIEYFTGFNYFRPNYRVNSDFVRALILAESAAVPDAISGKNAMGLGQIILTTGQQAGRELYKSKTHFRYVSKDTLQNITRQDLFDPATNILLTCYLIAKYNHKFDGRIELVVSAWNAGENTESLSLGQHAPYSETQDLIGKVNGYFIYLLRKKDALRY